LGYTISIFVLSIKQILLIPTIIEPPISSAIFGAVAIIAWMPLVGFALKLIAPTSICLSIFPLLSCSLSHSCSEQWPDYTTAQLCWAAILT